MYADTSIWLTPLFFQTDLLNLYLSLTNVHKSCVPSFTAVIWRLLLCQVCITFLFLCFRLNRALMLSFRPLFDHPSSVLSCDLVTLVYFYLVSYAFWGSEKCVCVTCNCLYASFFFFPSFIQLLLDKYLWPLHLWGLQQSGAEAHPTAPHLGESPKYLHFCKVNALCMSFFFPFFLVTLSLMVWSVCDSIHDMTHCQHWSHIKVGSSFDVRAAFSGLVCGLPLMLMLKHTLVVATLDNF